MRAPRSFCWLLPALVLVLIAWGSSSAAAADIFADGQAIPAAVRAIRQAAGAERKRVLRVEIGPQELIVQFQDPAARSHVDAWRFDRSSRLFASDRVSGPIPVRLNLVNPDLEANLFDLDDIDFGAAGTLHSTAASSPPSKDGCRRRGKRSRVRRRRVPHGSSNGSERGASWRD